MTTMKSVQTAGPGKIEIVEIERPVPGPRDLLVRIRACGICGTDPTFVQTGGMPPGPGWPTAAIPLGHEPAGQVVEAGAEVAGLQAAGADGVRLQGRPGRPALLDRLALAERIRRQTKLFTVIGAPADHIDDLVDGIAAGRADLAAIAE